MSSHFMLECRLPISFILRKRNKPDGARIALNDPLKTLGVVDLSIGTRSFGLIISLSTSSCTRFVLLTFGTSLFNQHSVVSVFRFLFETRFQLGFVGASVSIAITSVSRSLVLLVWAWRCLLPGTWSRLLPRCPVGPPGLVPLTWRRFLLLRPPRCPRDVDRSLRSVLQSSLYVHFKREALLPQVFESVSQSWPVKILFWNFGIFAFQEYFNLKFRSQICSASRNCSINWPCF